MNFSNPPQNFNALRDHIIGQHPHLPKRLAQIAAFALEQPDEIALGTAVSIAKKAQVQPSTLIRFAQALGYPGFTDLQAVFRDRLREKVLNYEERLNRVIAHGHDRPHEDILLEGFAEAAFRSTARLRDQIDPEQLAKAAQILAKAETIYIAGLRRSFPIAAYIAYALGKLGIKYCLLGATGGLEPELIELATPQDALLVISYTPYAEATVNLTNQAAAKNSAIVAITDSPLSPVAEKAHLWFELVEADFEGFRSLAASFTLAASLTLAIAHHRCSR